MGLMVVLVACLAWMGCGEVCVCVCQCVFVGVFVVLLGSFWRRLIVSVLCWMFYVLCVVGGTR